MKVFEKMPLYIQIEIIHNHLIIYGDAARIGAYFYKFRRLWADMEPRIRANRFSSVGERMALRRRFLRYLYSSKRSMVANKTERVGLGTFLLKAEKFDGVKEVLDSFDIRYSVRQIWEDWQCHMSDRK